MQNISFSEISKLNEEENLHKIILLYEELVVQIHENGNCAEASKIFTENYFYLLMLIFKSFVHADKIE